MTRTDGEHELVLGNKQLLSAFFVVVVLLGVFFTMGYFVGKNTATAGFNSGQSVSPGTRVDPAAKATDSSGSPVVPAPESTTPAIDPSSSSTPAPPPAERDVTPAENKQADREPAVEERSAKVRKPRVDE